MNPSTLNYQKVRELRDEGWTLQRIADHLGTRKGSVSKILKKMGIEVVRAAVAAAPRHVAKQGKASDHLLYLLDKTKKELEWIEATIPPTNSGEYRAWQDQKILFAAEMRKLITAMADISFKLYRAEEINEILQIMDEEIGYESRECQQRIRERIQKRRAIRFPLEQN